LALGGFGGFVELGNTLLEGMLLLVSEKLAARVLEPMLLVRAEDLMRELLIEIILLVEVAAVEDIVEDRASLPEFMLVDDILDDTGRELDIEDVFVVIGLGLKVADEVVLGDGGAVERETDDEAGRVKVDDFSGGVEPLHLPNLSLPRGSSMRGNVMLIIATSIAKKQDHISSLFNLILLRSDQERIHDA
jgi:hypothetical protein